MGALWWCEGCEMKSFCSGKRAVWWVENDCNGFCEVGNGNDGKLHAQLSWVNT